MEQVIANYTALGICTKCTYLHAEMGYQEGNCYRLPISCCIIGNNLEPGKVACDNYVAGIPAVIETVSRPY